MKRLLGIKEAHFLPCGGTGGSSVPSSSSPLLHEPLCEPVPSASRFPFYLDFPIWSVCLVPRTPSGPGVLLVYAAPLSTPLQLDAPNFSSVKWMTISCGPQTQMRALISRAYY